MTLAFSRALVFPLIALLGALFSWRLLSIPSRMEAAAFVIVLFLIPTLKYPKFGVYYLFCVSFFIPFFRRMYYLVAERPDLDYLMLVSDGVMCGLIMALVLLWMVNKERARGPLPFLVLAYAAILFLKIFLGNEGTTVNGFYGFKFNGLYVMFFFAGSYLISSAAETRRLMGFVSWTMVVTALYAINQILFGFTAFEQKWLDSITFTTIYIEGVVRPFSTYVSPASMSDGMTLLILLGVFWFRSRGRHGALFGILLIGCAIWPLLIASVRTNWLATAAGLFFYLVFLRLRTGWGKGLLITLLLGAAVGGALRGGSEGGELQTAALASQMGSKEKNLKDIMIRKRTQALANPLQEYSVQKRMATWAFIWGKVHHQPLGAGQGMVGYAHSYYFQVLGETGFPGILLFLAILAVGFTLGFRVVARSRDPDTVELARFLLAMLFTISILNLTGTHLHTPPGDLFFWFGLGCIHRFNRQLQEAEAAARAAEGDAPGAPGDGGGGDAGNPGSPGEANAPRRMPGAFAPGRLPAGGFGPVPGRLPA